MSRYKFKAKPIDPRIEREKRIAFWITVAATLLVFFAVGAGGAMVWTMGIVYIGSRVIINHRRRT